MSKNNMQNAWESKRKEDERLKKVLQKKKSDTETRVAKTEDQPVNNTESEAK